MATKKKSAKKNNIGPAIGAGAAALGAAAAAGAAGYYFYGTQHAKKHRQAASKWAKGLQKDVQKRVKSLSKIDAKAVGRIVDDAAAAYQGVRGVAATDVGMAAAELKRNWNKIQGEFKPSAAVTKTVKKATSVAKKTVKKVVKKAAPKKAAKKTAKRK